MAATVLISVTCGILSISTIGGNLMVSIAFTRYKQLQTLSNLFIFSLAISDIIVGVSSINFYSVYVVLQSWPLGIVVCDIWLVLDYVCCQASVIHLIMICIDRYLSLTRPFSYRVKRTKNKLRIAICLAWLIAFMQWAPWIISYPAIVGKNTVPEDDCYVQFLYESWYTTVLTAIAAYYLPVLIMFTIYVKIYQLVRTREEEIAKITNVPRKKISLARLQMPKTLRGNYNKALSRFSRTGVSVNELRETSRKDSDLRQKKRFLVRQKKAAKMLSVILLAFVITWLPYHVCVVITPFCPECISSEIWNFSYMLCYLNSTLNPFCYALGSRDFRRVFKKVLCCKNRDRSRSFGNEISEIQRNRDQNVNFQQVNGVFSNADEDNSSAPDAESMSDINKVTPHKQYGEANRDRTLTEIQEF